MKKRVWAALLAAVTIIALLSTGCAEKEDEETTSYELTAVEYYVPMLDKPVYRGQAYTAEIGTHKYFFDAAISTERCSEFTAAQEELCAYLAENSLHTPKTTYLILDERYGYASRDDRYAIIDINTTRTWEQIAYTMLCAMGEHTNYGYIYALANFAAAELGWECDQPGSPAYSLNEKNIDLLNLSYPCFSEQFVLAYDITLCKNTSLDLMAKMHNEWSEEEFLNRRDKLAKSISSDFEATYLKFAPAGPACTVNILTKYLTVQVSPEYFTTPVIVARNAKYEKIDSLTELIESYEKTDVRIGILRDIFGFDDKERADTFVVGQLPAVDAELANPLGLYFPSMNQIYSLIESALAHEYVHYIEFNSMTGETDPALEEWHIEALAYYYCVGVTFDYNMAYYDEYPTTRKYINEYIGQLYNEPYDELLYQRIVMRESDISGIEALTGYSEAFNPLSIFGEYFVRTYGDEVFISSMLYPSEIESFTGKTLDDIVTDWYADLSDTANDELLVVPPLYTENQPAE